MYKKTELWVVRAISAVHLQPKRHLHICQHLKIKNQGTFIIALNTKTFHENAHQNFLWKWNTTGSLGAGRGEKSKQIDHALHLELHLNPWAIQMYS